MPNSVIISDYYRLVSAHERAENVSRKRICFILMISIYFGLSKVLIVFRHCRNQYLIFGRPEISQTTIREIFGTIKMMSPVELKIFAEKIWPKSVRVEKFERFLCIGSPVFCEPPPITEREK